MPENTLFAPAERTPAEELLEDYRRMASAENIAQVFNALPYLAAILNSNRQMLFANSALLDRLGIKSVEHLIGARPGEALDCIHSAEHPGGCGTSEACRYCGAVNAILECQESDAKAVRECRIISSVEGAETSLDLSITAVMLSVADKKFTLLAIQDISDEKRRRNLESIFFHDVINTASSLNMLADFLNDYADEVELEEQLKQLARMSRSLTEEIVAQRDLAAAEAGEMSLDPSAIDCAELALEVAGQLERHKVAGGRSIELRPPDGTALELNSDRRLVKRVLVNMLKNALEAAPEGSVVQIGHLRTGPGVRFWVHNDGYIPREVQLQIFQRSFSTRGIDRGLGTYSMRLLTGRYLRGSISFETSGKGGTTFFLDLPLSLSSQ